MEQFLNTTFTQAVVKWEAAQVTWAIGSIGRWIFFDEKTSFNNKWAVSKLKWYCYSKRTYTQECAEVRVFWIWQ